MPNHGYCKNCWWWKEIPTIATVWQEVERKGQCFMHTHGGHNEYTEENVLALLKTTFRPELINRIDEIVTFNPLTKEVIYEVLDRIISDVNNL